MNDVTFLYRRLVRIALVTLLAASAQACIVYTFDGNNLQRVPAGKFACEAMHDEHQPVACLK